MNLNYIKFDNFKFYKLINSKKKKILILLTSILSHFNKSSIISILSFVAARSKAVLLNDVKNIIKYDYF